MNKTLTAERVFAISIRFYEHPFIQSLMEEFGVKGCTLAVAVLAQIGKSGTEARFGRKFRESISRNLPGISYNLVKMVVRRMVEAGFLDKKAFDERKVLTPPAEYIVDDIYDIGSGNVDKSMPYYYARNQFSSITSEETPVNSEETHISSEETVVNSEEIQKNSEETHINSEFFQKNSEKLRNSMSFDGDNLKK